MEDAVKAVQLGLTIARTMGLVTLSLFDLFFSFQAKDDLSTAFTLDTFADKTFVITTGSSFFLLIMSTVLAPFQGVLKTTTLDVNRRVSPMWGDGNARRPAESGAVSNRS